MDERRASTKKKSARLLTVFDRSRRKELGRLVEITRNGLLLIGKERIAIGATWCLSIGLPTELNDAATVRFDAESSWSEAAGTQFWTGFQIIDIAVDEEKKLEQLMADGWN